MAPRSVGTPVEGPYDSYTAEQLAALEDLKDPKYALGIAQAKYANHVLLPDGTLSKDVGQVEKEAKAALKELAGGDLTDPEHLQQMQNAARRAQEVSEHIAQKRFLFIPNGDNIVYFQCATAKNPDLPPVATTDDAEHLDQVKTDIQATVARAHARAAERRAAAKVGVTKP